MATDDERYPPPPWRTHGVATFCPVRVPSSTLVLPRGMQAQSFGGMSLGVLAYVEYRKPSPLTYRELIWMPAATKVDGRRGYYVAAMYVDCERSLAGGREIWALPKTLAEFSTTATGVRVEAADGTNLVMTMRPRGPSLPIRQKFATIQDRESTEWVRFSCRFDGRAQSSQVRIDTFCSTAIAWSSFDSTRRVPLLGVSLNFRATMNEPTVWPCISS